jgi:putative oxidoreductase
MERLAQDLSYAGTALLIARLVVGLMLAAHGAQKLFGWFGGYGLAGTGGWLESLGFRPGKRYAALAGVGEFAGGLLTALGLLGPVGPALMVAVMVVAMGSVHWSNGVFAAKNGVELPLMYGIAGVTFGLVGFGPYALDPALGLAGGWTPVLSIAVLAVGLVGGLLSLTLRHPAPAAPKV